MEPILGEIKIFAGVFAPKGWMYCQGQTLAISVNTALFSLLGTTYGGDGQTTFKLPNLCGRFPIGTGPSYSGTNYQQGMMAGTETTTLTVNQMPAHTHMVNAVSAEASTLSPAGAYPAASPGDPVSGSGVNIYSTSAPDVTMSPNAIASAGASQPVSILNPFLAMNYIIAVEGYYPSRP